MKILGIETSCDETAAAVVEDGTTVLSNVVNSQVNIHARYGGIVPEVASRQHLINILPVIEKALSDAAVMWKDISAIAVTNGPGLAGSLIVGVNTAKAIAFAQSLPLIGINHLEGHICANWLNGTKPVFPCICLIVSGGHSDIVLMSGHTSFKRLGQTRDDAAGEAFDKAARIMGLGYPGGPVIEATARGVVPTVQFPRAWLKDTCDFSFSGLKTAVLHYVEDHKAVNTNQIPDIAASFQEAVVDVLVTKTIQAAGALGIRQIMLAGGVAANTALKEHFLKQSPIPVQIPPPGLCTDNAAMIASCGYFRYSNGQNDGYAIDVIPGLNLA